MPGRRRTINGKQHFIYVQKNNTFYRKAPNKYKPYKMRMPRGLLLVPVFMLIGIGGVIAFFAVEEMKTSKMQAAYFSAVGKEIYFQLKDGEAHNWIVPTEGPYNQRLGYSYLPVFIKKLNVQGYEVKQQAQTSKTYNLLLRKGFYPVYKAKTVAGLEIVDDENTLLYRASYPSKVFSNFESIPPLLVRTLLHIENRELLEPSPETKNPVIEWKRFFLAAFGQLLRKVVPINTGGGSTLATQIEKFRYSPGGQTVNPLEKFRQIFSASLRVYMDGLDTREDRKRIVLDYLNSTPLSARPGFGEINSIGDGLWAWFGRNLDDAVLALNLTEENYDALKVKAKIFREILSLIMAQRRPTYYLISNRESLDKLTDAEIDRLYGAGIISENLRREAHAARLKFLVDPPLAPSTEFIEQKAISSLRAHLLSMLGLKNLYELDRLDLSVKSTIDGKTQQKVSEFLKKMSDHEFVQSIGMFGFRLLKTENDVSKIKWSVLLFEKKESGNLLRIQADNIDAPFNMNEGIKLDLGSTAKLRTLITYLEIIGELYRRYAGLSSEDLKDISKEAPDALTSWAVSWLAENPSATLEEVLTAALERKYSASPNEAFFTGGGLHSFVNFEKTDNGKILSVREALRNSVNLVFIRLMRDIVNYTIGQGQQTKEEILNNQQNPARREYLERFADQEGSIFLNRYINEYKNLSAEEILRKAISRARKSATAQMTLFRYIFPNAKFRQYLAFVREYTKANGEEEKLANLYQQLDVDRYSLADKGYITGLNPLELWLVGYLIKNPEVSRSKILEVSRPIRIESYTWLFRPSKKGAQNSRIRILLEKDAFEKIHKRWKRLGYPFDKLVPSLATAIGSSADRPEALADLMGIIMNDGVRKPLLRFEKLHFAKDTPFETVMTPKNEAGTRVLDPVVAKVVRSCLIEVVENGTAKRLKGAYKDENGNPLPIGGKTGTGDHRFEEFAAGGRLISSRIVNRTGTIVFFIGDRFFGTVTAHVAGEEAADYKFTSALSAQMLKSLSPILQPLISGGESAVQIPIFSQERKMNKDIGLDLSEPEEEGTLSIEKEIETLPEQKDEKETETE